MRRLLTIPLLALLTPLLADGNISFVMGGRSYQLTGGQAVLAKRNGKVQLIIAAKDMQNKMQFAVTGELTEQLSGPVELTTSFSPVSAVIVSARGIYSVAPAVMLARDEFMRYTKKEEVVTGELEDDPDDNVYDRLEECRRSRNDHCHRVAHEKRRKRKKIAVRYVKHGPTWVGKSRAERIATGDGIAKEEKYRDTTFAVRITPVIVDGKVVSLTGSFGGVMLFNEGMNQAVKIPLQNGQFTVQVENKP